VVTGRSLQHDISIPTDTGYITCTRRIYHVFCKNPHHTFSTHKRAFPSPTCQNYVKMCTSSCFLISDHNFNNSVHFPQRQSLLNSFSFFPCTNLDVCAALRVYAALMSDIVRTYFNKVDIFSHCIKTKCIFQEIFSLQMRKKKIEHEV